MAIRLPAIPEYQPSANSMAGLLFDSAAGLYLAIGDLLKAPTLNNPYSSLKQDSTKLADLLALYTIPYLEKVHEVNDLHLPHASRKANLVESLVVGLPLAFARFLEEIEESMAKLLLSLLDGSAPAGSKKHETASYLLRRAFIFQLNQSDQSILRLPLELARILEKKAQQEGWRKTVRRNSDICWMAANLLATCGVMHETVFLRYMQDLSRNLAEGKLSKPVTAIQASSSPYHGLPFPDNCSTLASYVTYKSSVDKVRLDSSQGPVYYCHSHVLDPYNIIDEQKKRMEFYYPDFSCRELLADPALPLRPIGHLSRYLEEELYLTAAEAGYTAAFWTLASLNGPDDAHLEIILNKIQFKARQKVPDLVHFFNEVIFNNLPRWVLWGNSSNVFLLEYSDLQDEASWQDDMTDAGYMTEQLALSPEEIVKIRQIQPAGAKIKTRSVPANVKSGRNDPCPCGSGKKYKKCCGR